MVGKTRILGWRATWVLRHRWEKGAKDGILGSNYEAHKLRTELKLGIWAKLYKAVGPVRKQPTNKETIKYTFAEGNLVNNYMVGIDLIVCRIWVDFTFKPTFGNNIK